MQAAGDSDGGLPGWWYRAASVSKVDLPPFFVRTGQVEFGADQGRGQQRREDATLPGRSTTDILPDGSPQPIGIATAFGKPAGDMAHQLTIATAARHLEADQPLFGQPLSENGERALPGGFAHFVSPACIQKDRGLKGHEAGIVDSPGLRALTALPLAALLSTIKTILTRRQTMAGVAILPKW